MLKNDRQYAYTKKKLNEFKIDLKEIKKKYSTDKNKLALLSQGYKEHIEQLKAEIAEYEKMQESPLPKVLLAKNVEQISRVITRLRVCRRFTQSQLAARIGCKQADISRLERESYRGYSIELLERIAKGLDAKIELKVIPKARPKKQKMIRKVVD